MFYHQDAKIEGIFVHHVGNKANDEFYSLSEEQVDLLDTNNKDALPNLLMQYYMKPFAKSNEVYRLHHENDFDLNDIYNFVTQFFESIIDLQHLSNYLARYLYDVSDHPKIKSGELHVVYFTSVQMEGEEHEAIGIFKTENKSEVLKLHYNQSNLSFGCISETISIDSLDKGAIIINTEAEEGYKVLITDNSSAGEAIYWKDNFLKVIARNDNYQMTTNFLKVYKNFVNEKLDDVYEIEEKDKAIMLNSAFNYFKQKESFDSEEFLQEVVGTEDVSALFQDYKNSFVSEFETEIAENFDISNKAVKKAASSYKSIIKLDKNFHLYIHGTKDLIENGYDEEKGMNFYKLYYENEN